MAVGFLTTGPTRERLGARARVGGRLSCGLLIVLSYLVLLVWLALALLLVTAALSVTLVGGMCNQLKQEYQCLDFRQLGNRGFFAFFAPRTFAGSSVPSRRILRGVAARGIVEWFGHGFVPTQILRMFKGRHNSFSIIVRSLEHTQK